MKSLHVLCSKGELYEGRLHLGRLSANQLDRLP